MVRIICVIPARLKSTRLPHKPLIDICGKTMLERTYLRAREVFSQDEVFIATDSNAILERAEKYTKNVVLTSADCLTGTDRISEFSKVIDADVYVNLQGDEPIMPIGNLKKIKNIASLEPNKIVNGYAKIIAHQEFFSRMIPKVVMKEHGYLAYMSRAPIPGNKENAFKLGYKQICVYAFPKRYLEVYGLGTKKGTIENIEDIEILRLLELGHDIKMEKMSSNTVAVDTMEDLERVRMIIETQGENLEEYECN